MFVNHNSTGSCDILAPCAELCLRQRAISHLYLQLSLLLLGVTRLWIWELRCICTFMQSVPVFLVYVWWCMGSSLLEMRNFSGSNFIVHFSSHVDTYISFFIHGFSLNAFVYQTTGFSLRVTQHFKYEIKRMFCEIVKLLLLWKHAIYKIEWETKWCVFHTKRLYNRFDIVWSWSANPLVNCCNLCFTIAPRIQLKGVKSEK